MNTPAGGVTLPELLPCPFCGSAPGLYHRTKHNRGTTTVCCDNVECMTQKLGFGRTKAEREANAIAAWNIRAALAGEWRDIASAPKGGGAEYVTDPSYVEPPRILLLFADGKQSVGYWDWYYAEGGNGYEGGTAWIEPCSGERLDVHYGPPTHWMPAAPLPKEPGHG